MTEFGHIYGRGAGVCIDIWGAGPFVLTVAGKTFRFEDSDRFGPALISKRGELLKNPYPGERSPFWRAHRIWVRQGRRVEDEINCIWDEPKRTVIKLLGNRVAVVVEQGEEDGAFVTTTEISPPGRSTPEASL